MLLPFRLKPLKLPNNKLQALQRLKIQLKNDKRYRNHYNAFIKEMLDKGYAETVPESDLSDETSTVWYIPYHGVYHPQKPDKLPVVFDCRVNYQNESLNSHLLQGPDLTNGLIGLLCRFRPSPIVFLSDLEGMLHQFQVSETHQN